MTLRGYGPRLWPMALAAAVVIGGVGTPDAALAGSLDKKVVSELLASGGWAPIGSEPAIGLSMYEKPLASVGLTAYMAVRDIPADVDPNTVWALILDVERHEHFGDKLAESTVIARHGNSIDSYQVLKPPPLMAAAQRYWFVHSEIETNVGGTEGHHRRCWSALPTDSNADVRARVAEKYPDASLISLTHGCWEVVPAAPGASARLRYRTVSDPGGTLARTAVSMLTTRTLPENLANFINSARK